MARTKAKPPASVDALMAALDHPLKRELESVRRAILAASPKIEDGVKWNAPSFHIGGAYFATLNLRAKDEVQVILHLGAKTRPDLEPFTIADPSRLLIWLAPDRAQAKLGAGRALAANTRAFAAIVRAWIKQL